MNKPTRTYDPGQPGECLSQGNGQWLVQSHRTEDSYYLVDLNEGTCTCPHAMLRDPEGGCKHYQQAKAAAVRSTKEKARSMPAHELRRALRTRQYRPEISGAIQEILWEKLNAIVAHAQEQVRNRTYCRV